MSEPRPMCDVVLEGGVTSGIVYPGVLTQLAQEYDLKNIGGTSAGAIAAGIGAAAQHGRATGRVPEAFTAVGLLPGELAEPPTRHSVERWRRVMAGVLGKRRVRIPRTRLEALFQPERRTRRLYRTLVGLAGERVSLGTAVRRGLWAALRDFWVTLAAGLLALAGLVAAVAWAIAGVWAGASNGAVGDHLMVGYVVALSVLAVVMGVVGGVAVGLVRALGQLPDNLYGLCTGRRTRDSLTPWLIRKLDSLSGTKSLVLTLGQLWGAGCDEGEARRRAVDPSEREVNLELVTTCLTLGRAYRLPFDRRARFYFRPDEMRRLFPEHIVRWMELHPGTDPNDDEGGGDDLVRPVIRGMHPLPDPWNLPVIVAVRLSLSYPILLSAVPLWSFGDPALRDGTERMPEGPFPKLRRMWFTDGGVTSNFPVHFFDALLPSRPTFGIDLRRTDVEPEVRDWTDPELWTTEGLHSGLNGLVGFVGQIVKSAHGWMDGLTMTLPGYRERITHVDQRADHGEGGQNIRMTDKTIATLATRGTKAGRHIVDRWRDPAASNSEWSKHRIDRYLLATHALGDQMVGVRRAFEGDHVSPGPSYETVVRCCVAPGRGGERLLAANRRLMSISCRWSCPDHPFRLVEPPRPCAELQMMPPL